MSKKRLSARWITQTAVLLALLIALQSITKPFGQYVTGSCVNAVLALAVLVAGWGSGLTVALVSPLLAFFLGIAPNPFAVPAIMVGNAVYVALLRWICGNCRKFWRMAVGWIAAAAGKFATLYFVVVVLICNVFADKIGKAAKVLQATFSWPQLITALIGGAVALSVTPILKKVLKKQ